MIEYLLVEVLSSLSIGDLLLQEGSGAHLDVHDRRVVEGVEKVLHFDEGLALEIHRESG